MLSRIVLVALLAGGLAGLAGSLLQHLTVVPLILAAEVYEKAPKHQHHEMGASVSMPELTSATQSRAAAPAVTSESVAEPEGAPWSGYERVAITTVATVGAAVGFSLMLLVLMISSGDKLDWKRALGWGAAGFVVCGLAPAMGLAPELPGSSGAALEARQLWWVGTAIATAAGLWLMLRPGAHWRIAVGVLLLLAPHVIGAPHPQAFASTVPAELAAEFTARSLVLQAVLWLMMAGFAGYFWSRGETASPARPA